MKTRLTGAAWAFLIALPLCAAHGDSNIDPEAPYAWGENVGWFNAVADGTNGVTVTPAILSGYIWGENVGWIFLGVSFLYSGVMVVYLIYAP